MISAFLIVIVISLLIYIDILNLSRNQKYNYKKLNKYGLLFAISICFISIIFWGYFATDPNKVMKLFTNLPNNRPEDANSFSISGTWGDSFGAINCLFTILGFASVVITIILQIKINGEQNDSDYNKNFEQRVYENIKLLREIKSDIIIFYGRPDRRTKLVGFEAIHRLCHEYGDKLSDFKRRYHGPFNADSINNFYMGIYPNVESSLGAFFRTLYFILDEIKNDERISPMNKFRYGRLIRAQLSENDISLIALNGLSSISKDMGELIIYFRLLKYHKKDSMLFNTIKNFYPSESWSSRD